LLDLANVKSKVLPVIVGGIQSSLKVELVVVVVLVVVVPELGVTSSVDLLHPYKKTKLSEIDITNKKAFFNISE
jgi:hypothetical protein